MAILQDVVLSIKENLCLSDLPPAIADEMITDRFRRVTIPDFSVICPRIEEFRMGSPHLVDPFEATAQATKFGIRYYVPKEVVAQFNIISITSVTPISRYGYGDISWPYAVGYDATNVIGGVSDMKTMAAIGQNMAPALTFRYDNMNHIIVVYSGWNTATYQVKATIMHDLSLVSITDSSLPTFRELAEYDIGRMIYNKVKRKGTLETPAGNFDLKIDDLQDCDNKYRELFKELKEEASLDFEEPQWY